MDIEPCTQRPHIACTGLGQLRKPFVGESRSLQLAHLLRTLRQPGLLNFLLQIDDVLQLLDEPRIDHAIFVHLLVVDAKMQSLRDLEQPVRRRRS